MFKGIKTKYCIITVLSSAFLAFGLYHVHSLAGVTEGGVVGLNLLLEHWFSISPAITNFVANVICYLLGWKLLGRKFIIYSAVATVSFSLSYAIIEQFPPLWPQLANMPLVASLVGAVFVGVGCGLCVKVGGAVSGDDALAMCISHVFRIDIQWAYLATDLTVLLLSLTYIPIGKIWYSLLTVLLSGQIIGLIQRTPSVSEQ
nr:YitT family protein [Oscillospiraceae bacterium]MBQ8245467.1 YitT family protein [Oscillospiraceae bacterium]